MKQRRPNGHGTIEQLSSGRHRARLPMPDGQRHTVGTFDTYEDADGTIAAVLTEQATNGVEFVGGATLRGALPRFLDDTEQMKSYAAMPNLRSIARCWLETAPFADWPVRQVTTPAAQRWVNKMAKKPGASRLSIGQRVTALRKFFAWAIGERLCDTNPAKDVTVPRGESRTEEAWTYLTPDEQTRFLACQEIPELWRLQIAIAIGTGIREGEHFALRLADVHTETDPRLVIRYGSKRRGPKGRKIRIVPLTGAALEAVRRWLELLPAHCPKNEHRLFFPGTRGGFHKVADIPGWAAWLAAAGIKRRVRWHDLRHTCGASLVSGWWGRAWSLQEVRDLLGHWSIKETERYAHLAPDALRRAAAETSGGPRAVHAEAAVPGNPKHIQAVTDSAGVDNGVNPRPESFRELTPLFGPELDRIAGELLETAAAGQDCHALKLRLASAAMGSPLVRLAVEAMGEGTHALDRALELAARIRASGQACRVPMVGGLS